MSHDDIERARRELRAEPAPAQDRFPLLAVRPDWPPSPYVVPSDLTEAEAREYALYADEAIVREEMAERYQPTEVEGLPVPDPDGRPIAPMERDRAEDAMLAAVEAERPDDRDWYERIDTGGQMRRLSDRPDERVADRDGADWYRTHVKERETGPVPDPDRTRNR